jgi:hypothetical protein
MTRRYCQSCGQQYVSTSESTICGLCQVLQAEAELLKKEAEERDSAVPWDEAE